MRKVWEIKSRGLKTSSFSPVFLPWQPPGPPAHWYLFSSLCSSSQPFSLSSPFHSAKGIFTWWSQTMLFITSLDGARTSAPGFFVKSSALPKKCVEVLLHIYEVSGVVCVRPGSNLRNSVVSCYQENRSVGGLSSFSRQKQNPLWDPGENSTVIGFFISSTPPGDDVNLCVFLCLRPPPVIHCRGRS